MHHTSAPTAFLVISLCRIGLSPQACASPFEGLSATEPVVLTGGQVPELLGAPVATIRA